MSLIDMIRGLYFKFPQPVRVLASPVLAMLPANLKFGSTYTRWAQDIARSENDAEFVQMYRNQHLTDLLMVCAKSNPHYLAMFRSIFGTKISPKDISASALQELPILTKDDVRAEPERYTVKSVTKLDVATTSGSSGIPLRFYLDKGRGVKEWAFVHHIWARSGFCPGMCVAVLRGLQIGGGERQPWEFDKTLSELRLSPFHLIPEHMARYLELIEKYEVRFVWGYPSAISILAKFALSVGWTSPQALIGVIPISETLLPYQREIIRFAFGNCKIAPTYGLSEKSAIAGEVDGSNDVYEFEPLYGITELVDGDGKEITKIGEVGRIIGTGFISTGMPLLRYDTGDLAELVRPAVQENCYRLRLNRIRSRWGQEFVVAHNGALISIAAINIHSAVYSKIHAFQFFQDVLGLVDVLVVPVKGYGENEIHPFVQEIQKKVGSGVSFSLRLVDALPRNSRGKQKFIDQRLRIRNW